MFWTVGKPVAQGGDANGRVLEETRATSSRKLVSANRPAELVERRAGDGGSVRWLGLREPAAKYSNNVKHI